MNETKSKSAWKTIGSIRKGKTGNLYIKVTEGVTLEKDTVVQLQDPRKRNLDMAGRGYITQEVAEERNSKVPDYIRYDLVLAPPKAE